MQGINIYLKSQYLLNPFQVPAAPQNPDAPQGGLPTLYQGGGGGGGFNPYNTNMSNVRQDYRPDFDFRAYQDFEGRYGDSLETMDRKQMDMYPDYYGVNTGVPKTGIGAAFSKIADFIPYVGTFKRGAEFLGNTFGRFMPVNERAIAENEARGLGVFTDDIGRVVTDNYNTPQGIMAGYNLNKIDQGTFDKRRSTIEKAIERRKASGQDYSGLMDKLGLLEEAEDLYLGPTGILTKRNDIAVFRRQKKIDDINRRKAEAKAANDAAKARALQIQAAAQTQGISRREAERQQQAIERDNQATESRGRQELGSSYDEGTYCFDPNTLIQMADGSEKKIKEIQLGDQTKGGEVTGVFQFKASDEIHDYKGVTVAGSHYVKEDGRFIMVKDSPISVKIDKIPVVYSLDTTGRRIFIKDIEFADYNGDGIAKGFLANAGVDLSGFDKEVLRQVENRLI